MNFKVFLKSMMSYIKNATEITVRSFIACCELNFSPKLFDCVCNNNNEGEPQQDKTTGV